MPGRSQRRPGEGQTTNIAGFPGGSEQDSRRRRDRICPGCSSGEGFHIEEQCKRRGRSIQHIHVTIYDQPPKWLTVGVGDGDTRTQIGMNGTRNRRQKKAYGLLNPMNYYCSQK